LAVEYDLVIIGATAAARAAAIEAVSLRARVALVLPSVSSKVHPQSDFYPYALAQIASSNRFNLTPQQPPSSYPWKYALAAIDRLEAQADPALLAAMGVDTIIGMGEFHRQPQLGFRVNNRSLRARAYLLASGSVADYPLIPGIQAAGYLNIDRLPSLVVGLASLFSLGRGSANAERLPQQKENLEIPRRWAIIGTESIGVELAQTLAKLGCQVKLIVTTAQILPYEDLDLANLIQAQIEADGVEVCLETTVTQIIQQGNAKLVMIGDNSIAVDQIFMALPERPFLEPFNLLGVGVDYRESGVSVDRQLRTSHPQIYACGSVCGSVLGGYHSQGLTESEAKIAVKNALSWWKTKVDYRQYHQLPWAIYTDPPLARVGMTVDTATNSDRGDLVILQKYLKTCPQAILNNITSGFCQIVVTRSGKILGAEIVGQNAPELIQILAVAIQQHLKITDLTKFPCLSPTYTEFIYQAAQEWHTYDRHQHQNHRLLNRLFWWK
jgi:pyruvate/2-oxoglutarate dehydrogenase complex dihydrolipoamide dehydrogenase (E3) component